MKTPTAILTSDWHLREDTPKCRTDDYQKAQWNKIKFIINLSNQYTCPILVAGDIFDKWKPSPYLLQQALSSLSARVIVIPGQHDLPNHNLNLFERCGLAVLHKGAKANVLSISPMINTKTENYSYSLGDGTYRVTGFPYGTDLKDMSDPNLVIKQIALCHTLAYEKKPWPDAPASGNAKAIMKKLSSFSLIVCGDNHSPFVVKRGKQLLVNPGSIMRMSVNQIDHKPRVYLWYADTNEVEAVYLPIEDGVISTGHLEAQEKKDKRMEAFVSRLDDGYEVSLSFEENLKAYFASNKTRDRIMELVWESIEG